MDLAARTRSPCHHRSLSVAPPVDASHAAEGWARHRRLHARREGGGSEIQPPATGIWPPCHTVAHHHRAILWWRGRCEGEEGAPSLAYWLCGRGRRRGEEEGRHSREMEGEGERTTPRSGDRVRGRRAAGRVG